MLHGAGGDAAGGLDPWLARAYEAWLILLPPESRGRTWDVILGRFGPDVDFIDDAHIVDAALSRLAEPD
ncbi:MAG: hypothetical protein ACLGI2_12685 [Acidimicrobiia bacterium]